jgi:outer membrane protein OmpA-like peptidoglycan-associated protein
MTNLFKDLAGPDESGATMAEIGQTKVVNNVFADNSAEIRKEATADLQKIVAELTKNKTMIVQVTAHSNQHADRAASMALSNQRASNIVDFLVKAGVDKKRLSYTGVGHDVLINSKVAISQEAMSSSVEFKLVKY